MTNTALQRITQAVLTNKSGGAVAKGDCVIIDTANAAAFTTTTTSPFLNGIIGVVIEPNGIANNAAGMIQFAGPCGQINLSGSASVGDLFKTHTVAKQAVRHAPGILAGDFGICTGTGTTPACILWGLPAGATGAGSGDFSGPGSSVAGHVVTFADTTGKLGSDGGVLPAGFVADFQQTVYTGAAANINCGTSVDGAFVDADATNAKITFTPASAGKYKVTMTFSHYRKAAILDVFFLISDGTTSSPSQESYEVGAGAEDMIIVALSFVFTWTAVAQTVNLKKKVTTASTVTANVIECDSGNSQGLQMLVERIGS